MILSQEIEGIEEDMPKINMICLYKNMMILINIALLRKFLRNINY